MGNKVNDLSGNGNTGTLNGFAFPSTAASGWNPGRIGRTLAYDAGNDNVSTSTTVFNLGIRRHATFMAWVKFRAWTDTASEIISDWNLSQGMTLRGQTPDKIIFFVYPNNHRMTVNGVVSLGAWYHIVGIMDDAFIRVFVNGEEVGTPVALNEDIGSSAGSLRFGVRGDLGVNTFQNGLIDDVRIYNRALEHKEIQDIMDEPFSSFATVDVALLRVASLMAMERSISRRVHGRIFGRVN